MRGRASACVDALGEGPRCEGIRWNVKWCETQDVNCNMDAKCKLSYHHLISSQVFRLLGRSHCFPICAR